MIQLNDQIARPSLAGLKRLWDEGMMKVVQGVGYPEQNLSHFGLQISGQVPRIAMKLYVPVGWDDMWRRPFLIM